MSLRDYKSEQVASALVEVFDRIYTYPLLRWRAFLRLLLFTTVVSVIFVFEAYRYNLIVWSPSFYLIGLLFNVLTDHLSLTCWMPLGQSQVSPELISEDGSTPGFDIT